MTIFTIIHTAPMTLPGCRSVHVTRLWRFLSAVVVSILLAPSVSACDEVTHARMTELAISAVQSQELRDLLERHAGVVKFGSWYPDWGQYIDHPFADPNHLQDPFLYAFLDYLRMPGVRVTDEYPLLVSLFMGASAHSLQDQYYDTVFMARLKEVDQGLSGDMEMGIINIARHGYLNMKVEPYLPAGDLEKIYASSGMFDRYGVRQDSFSRDFTKGVRGQALQMRGLKLLSFLSSGRMAGDMPWGARNIMDAPGGILDAARVTAQHWEALWLQLSGMEPPLFSASYPPQGGTLYSADSGSSYGRVTLVSCREISPSAFAPDSVVFIGRNGGVVAGKILWPLEDSSHPGGGTNVVQCIPLTSLSPGTGYMLHVGPGAYGTQGERLMEPFRLFFTVPQGSLSETTGQDVLGESQFRLGIFLFAICISLGAVMFGVPAFHQLARDALAAERLREGGTLPAGPRALTMVGGMALRAGGVVVAAAGIYFLYSGGRVFLTLIRSIF